ncbi:MAG: hypothetical protein AAF481_20245 [Acidobacteriota bacterium]
MSRRAFRIVAVTVLAAVLLGAAGVVAWDWVADYRLYRRAVASLALPGQEPAGSLGEFLRVRRALAFYDAAERLAERNATAEEVRAALGEPDQVEEIDGHHAWFYQGPVFWEKRQPTIVMDIDLETSQVTSVGYHHHD